LNKLITEVNENEWNKIWWRDKTNF
jgi:hypothetical protein